MHLRRKRIVCLCEPESIADFRSDGATERLQEYLMSPRNTSAQNAALSHVDARDGRVPDNPINHAFDILSARAIDMHKCAWKR